MSTTLLYILVAIIIMQLAMLIILHQNASEKLRQNKYNYGLKALEMEKRIKSLQQAILSYHSKIDEINIQIDEYKAL